MVVNTKLQFAFFGTPDVASETLEILKAGGFLPSIIITSPDKPQGRKMLITPPPVKIWAIENNIPYIQPEVLNDEVIQRLGINLDISIVIAYGKIIPEKVLQIPKYGSINIHYSLLPKYRGASPVESTILNGDTETGVAIQKMALKIDTGEIITIAKTAITPTETAPELRKRLIQLGGDLLVQILPEIALGESTSLPQEETKATYCHKIKKEDGLLDEADSAEKKYNKFRAYAYWPRTFFFQDGKRIIVTDATLEDGKFVIKKVLPEGKKEVPYVVFLQNTTISK